MAGQLIVKTTGGRIMAGTIIPVLLRLGWLEEESSQASPTGNLTTTDITLRTRIARDQTEQTQMDSGTMHIHDLNATILHLLGIDHTRLTYRYQGRDFRLTDVHGHVITDILT